MFRIISFLKKWTLPSAIVIGTVLYLVFSKIELLSAAGDKLGVFFDYIFPFCVFLTLFTTFSKVDFHKMRITCWHSCLVLCQIVMILLTVGSILLFNLEGEMKLIFEAILTCVIAPCAVAAPVVTFKLGGDINTMTTYTLISSLLCSITIPIVFPILESVEGVTFISSCMMILSRLSMVIILPLLLGWFVRHYVKNIYKFILRHPNLSYYLWAITLAITTGVTVKNISNSNSSLFTLLLIAVGSFSICIIHFIIGRISGKRYNEKINCGQGMFQKNTGMAIWVSYMYLHPVASIGAGCYVLWQNIINSWEIAEHERERDREMEMEMEMEKKGYG